MTYSLSRFRHTKPAPPFEIGGEYQRRGPEHHLRDALGSVELIGESELFANLSDGDLVTVRAQNGDEFSLYIDQVRLVYKSQERFSLPPKPHAQRFVAFVDRVRDFFLRSGLTELITPTLVRCPGLEPSLEPFSTEVRFGQQSQTAYLPTSPEIHLKKALGAGFSDIFEIKTCFRAGEFSNHHDSEFFMLEWYRSFADLKWIEADLRALLYSLAEDGWVYGRMPQVQETDFASLFKTHLHFDLTPASSASELKNLCDDLGVHNTPDDSFNDLFHRLLFDRLEAEINKMGPVIIKRFPPSQAALAKLDKDGWADRFEFYWNGLEIANAFNEVTDPVEQLARWDLEKKERVRLGTSSLPHDPGLLRALRRGMPPTGGIALGLERLYMAAARVDNIRDLKLFSISDLFV